jgi:hypothetical protein
MEQHKTGIMEDWNAGRMGQHSAEYWNVGSMEEWNDKNPEE